jgi:hypothetical protein
MPRFFDQLLISPGMKETSQALRKSIVILGDNVSDYYWMGNPQEVWTLEKDFPNVAPPFEHFFIDFRAPTAIVSEVNGQLPWDAAKAREWGVFFETTDVTALAKRMEVPEQRQAVFASTQWHLDQMMRTIATLQTEVSQKTGKDPQKITASDLTPAQHWYVQQYQMMRTEVETMQKGEWLKVQRLYTERYQETNTKWLVRAHLYLGIQRDSQYSYVPTWLWDFPVTPQGQFVTIDDNPICYAEPKRQYLLQVLPHVAETLHVSVREASQLMYQAMVHYFYPALLTISFLHCKNVTLQQQLSSPPRSKKAKKHSKPASPRITYHILDIEPMKRVLKTEGNIEQNGLKKALHICRGHFANYESGKGLFGKYHGTYWISQHVRGSAEQGIHLKDYRLKDVEKNERIQGMDE